MTEELLALFTILRTFYSECVIFCLLLCWKRKLFLVYQNLTLKPVGFFLTKQGSADTSISLCHTNITYKVSYQSHQNNRAHNVFWFADKYYALTKLSLQLGTPTGNG